MREDLKLQFYDALKRYKKKRDAKDMDIMWRILSLATHEDHAAADAMVRAVKWSGLDLYTELARHSM